MKVLALKAGHDGSVAFVDSGQLMFSLEAEKDSISRHSDITAQLVVDALTIAPGFPDVLAIGGWHKVLPGVPAQVAAGYRGLEQGNAVPGSLLGQEIRIYSSSHERSHLIGGVALSPFDPRGELAVLIWEGVIGSFYHWRGSPQRVTCHPVLDQPGARYSALFALADSSFPDAGSSPPTSYAGKLMALAGYADAVPPSPDSQQVVASLLRRRALHPFHKGHYRRSGLYNCGVETPEFCRAARHMTDQLFEAFLIAAKRDLPSGLPLVISGGCGLNCEWNSRWRACDHFGEVFIPPCTDDSGSAIGTAVDAAVAAGEECRLDWTVFAGSRFEWDAAPTAGQWLRRPARASDIAHALSCGCVVAWVQGRTEIGPRALGHRSLLASAAHSEMRDTLNRIKERESYRPVAPICLEEELGAWFDSDIPDPYMLFFRRVRRPEVLPAVTHADGSARVQSVSAAFDSRVHELLTEYRSQTGIPVLCNTSLNFPGRGFINRLSELVGYCERVGIDHIVVDDESFVRSSHTSCGAPG
jgi:hydroxymethyl cephem carbamoyltransferase